MTSETRPSESSLLLRAIAGEEEALREIFELHRPRLARMVSVRMHPRLQGRLDPADVLQEAFLDAWRGLSSFEADHSQSFFLWLRAITGNKLLHLQRQHLGAELRDAGREVSLRQRGMPDATSLSIAAQLLGRFTSASQAAMRVELQARLQEVLNSMDPIDRDVLVLRHFEQLSNEEASEVLGVKSSAASSRYVRALERIREILKRMPGFFES